MIKSQSKINRKRTTVPRMLARITPETSLSDIRSLLERLLHLLSVEVTPKATRKPRDRRKQRLLNNLTDYAVWRLWQYGGGDMTQSEIADHLGMNQPRVSIMCQSYARRTYQTR